jgi:hypothetical protein
MYRSMIGGLLYLTATRPGIMHVVCLVARFQEEPKKEHVTVVKRIFRYLKGTLDYGLWYPNDIKFTLNACTNADWARCVDDQKSTSGGALFLRCKLVSWLRKKRDSIYLSTTKAKYITTTSCCTQVLWMKKNLKDIGVMCDEPIPIFCDNTSAINISNNLVIRSTKKHVSIRYNFLREKVLENEGGLEYVSTKY